MFLFNLLPTSCNISTLIQFTHMEFKNLNTDQGLEELNRSLGHFSYIDGWVPTQSDNKHFDQVAASVDGKKFPHVKRWRDHIASFSAEERKA